MNGVAPLELVDALDLDRDPGPWTEIALRPKRFQDPCVAEALAEYTGQRTDRTEKIAG